jgi:FkbM family methyltransferase
MIRSFIRRFLPTRWNHFVTQFRLNAAIWSFSPRTISRKYGHHVLQVRVCDILAEGWYDHDWDEPLEIAFLRSGKLRPGALVFDLGAHQGVVAMILSREVGESGRVVAVEGSAHNVRCARTNASLNDFVNIEVIHALVSDMAGTELAFSNTLNGSVSAGGIGENVSTISIDSLAAKHGPPDVVFVDVEGFEIHALRGGSNTLNGSADFFVEVHANCGLDPYGTAEDVLAFFDPMRFDLFIALGEGAPFRQIVAGEHLPTSRFFLIAQSRTGL